MWDGAVLLLSVVCSVGCSGPAMVSGVQCGVERSWCGQWCEVWDGAVLLWSVVCSVWWSGPAAVSGVQCGVEWFCCGHWCAVWGGVVLLWSVVFRVGMEPSCCGQWCAGLVRVVLLWSGSSRHSMMSLLSLGSVLLVACLEFVFSHKLLAFVFPGILNLDKRFSPNVDSCIEYYSNPF